MTLIEPNKLKRVVRGIVTAHPDEIGCTACFERLDEFVDLTLAGKDAATALPLVNDHLQRCANCHEEFEALLEAVKAMQV
jgi:hypothetical protein